MLFWGKHEEKGEMGAAREGDWKLVLQFWKPKVQLFNLAADIAEKHDLAAEQPDRAARMHQAWIEWNAQLPPPASVTAKKEKTATPPPAPPGAK